MKILMLCRHLWLVFALFTKNWTFGKFLVKGYTYVRYMVETIRILYKFILFFSLFSFIGFEPKEL